jgi:hypothetical protein
MSLALLLSALPLWAAAPPTAEPTHWSFRSPVQQAPPAVQNAGWCRNPIDAFVLARLEKAALRPAAQADRVALIRRLTIDLTGLPPTPEDVDAFVSDTSPDAYDRLVDRLLASPHFGERWAQHWLDVARFAETNGYEGDAERPQSWRYRDWVVRAMNADLPYDRFVTLQVAGDLLAKEDRDGLFAAGFNRCGPIHQVSGNVDPAEVRNEFLTEVNAGVGGAFLGLTMNCARCHDHKFDPIPARDYYRLEAFFSAAKPKEVELAGDAERSAHAKELAAWQAKISPLRAQVAKLDAPYRAKISQAKREKLEEPYKKALATDASKRTAEQQKLAAQANTLIKVTWDEVIAALSDEDREKRTALREQMHKITASAPVPPARAWTLEESKESLASYVLKRGDWQRKGKKVEPGIPMVFGGQATSPNNRLGLAKWLTARDHPLTARVIVNRLWQHHVGKGIVRTPNDFGLRGDRPSHPELLDWLAVELMQSGWSLKHVHRMIVTSATYQMADHSEQQAKAETIDPDNRLLWKMNRRRLEGEALRDCVLRVTGRLTEWLGGPMIRVPLEPETYDLIFTEDEPDGLWPVTPDERQHDRRTIYLFAKRNVRLPLLEALDQPDTLTSCPVRPVSTFAPQALILLNGPFMQSQAKAFASRLYREAKTTEGRIERAYRLTLGKVPSQTEQKMSAAFIREQAELLRERLRARETVALPDDLPEGVDVAEAAALSDLCLALLNRNAFVHY